MCELEVVEDIAGNTNGTAATATQINLIDGVSGAVSTADYTAELQNGTYVDSANPTAAEIQAVIDVVNALAEVVEDIAGNTNGTAATATQINLIDGVSGAVEARDYTAGLENGTYVDSANPTAAEIQAVVDAVNASVDEAYAEVVEDIAGNTNGTAATATQINLIDGVSGAVSTADYTAELQNGTYVDSSNPTAAEIQTVIDVVNALAEVVEDIAGNTNGTAATATQINLIDGVSGAVEARDYTAGLENGTYVDSANPTAAEIQAVVDAVNASVDEAYAEVVEDIAGNTNGTAATATQINLIDGVSGAVSTADYTAELQNGTYVDSSNPTAAEIQTVIDVVNALAEVVEDIAGNTNGTAATATQINLIDGVSGAVEARDYTAGLENGTYVDSANPTAAEIQAVVDAVNASVDEAYAEVVEDIAGNTNGTAATATQINLIDGVSGAVSTADYTAELQNGTYVDSSNPTAAEIQTVIDVVNALAEVVEDIAGNTNGTAATATQINLIDGVSGAVEARDYTAGLENGTYVDSANPTAAEIQAVVDAVNATILPDNISITDNSLDSYVVSVYDTDYGSPALDIPGIIDNNTNEIKIDIPYTVSSGTVDLLAFSTSKIIDSSLLENSESDVKLTFSYEAQTGLTGTGTFEGRITVDDSSGNADDTANANKLDIDTDVDFELVSFEYGIDNTGALGTYTITVQNGVKDRMAGVSDNASNTESHKFVYIPVVSPDTGKVWLNNNLGAEYADATNPNGNFNPRQQATGISDYLAYGSLFQWGRKADGHELLTRTAASNAGTVAVNGTTTTNSNDPTHANYIIEELAPNDWRVSQDDTLWTDESSANNVCPVGWRVPSEAELTAETTAAATNIITNVDTAQDNFLKLTPAGYRRFASGDMNNVGSVGYYLTSDVSGSYTRLLSMLSGNATFASSIRVNSSSVRCVKD